MTTNVEIGHGQGLKKASVQVGRHDVSGLPHSLAQPLGDRAASGADFQTVPAFTHPERLQVFNRARIKELLKAPESLPCVDPRGVKRILVHWGGIVRWGHRETSAAGARNPYRAAPQVRWGNANGASTF